MALVSACSLIECKSLFPSLYITLPIPVSPFSLPIDILKMDIKISQWTLNLSLPEFCQAILCKEICLPFLSNHACGFDDIIRVYKAMHTHLFAGSFKAWLVTPVNVHC